MRPPSRSPQSLCPSLTHRKPCCSRPHRTYSSFVPPPEAKSSYVPAAGESPFDPQSYLSLLPPPTSLLSAFAHRVGLLAPNASSQLSARVIPLVQQVCTHPSYVGYFLSQRPDEPIPRSNASLDVLGNSLLGLFAAEYVHALYPHMPTRAVKAAVSAYVGPNTLCAVAREWGAVALLRWHRQPRTAEHSALIHSDALQTIPRALVGLVSHLNSPSHARKFAEAFFLSRQVDLRSLLKFRDPKQSLVDTLIKFGWEKPASRLLAESGRHSVHSIYIVAIFSGATKLGEGFGSSIRMAEYRACEDAMLRLYLTRAPDSTFDKPTTTWDTSDTLFGSEPPEPDLLDDYSAPQLGEAEIVRDYTDKSGVVLGGRNAPGQQKFQQRLADEATDEAQEREVTAMR